MNNILINTFHTRDTFGGLKNFTESLVSEIIKQNNANFQISAYLKETYYGCFGENIRYTPPEKIKRHWFNQGPFLNTQYDLIHHTCQSFEGNLKPSYFKKKQNIVTLHDLNFLHEGRSWWSTKKRLIRLRNQLPYTNKIIAISNFAKNDFLNNFSFNEDDISVIYNGVVTPKNDKNHAPNYIPNKDFLFCLAFLNSKKNQHSLIPLLKNFDGELILAGGNHNTEAKTYIETQILPIAKKWGVLEKIKIIGQVSESDKNWYLHNCKAFLFPSLAEGFGMPIIEAFHCGKPVFISNKTSLPEIGGEHAFIFPSFDPEEMIQTFNEGLRLYSQNLDDNQKKYKLWAKKFSWESAAEKYLDMYTYLLR